MMVYHGSYRAIEKPDTIHSGKYVDFGAGFYTTADYAQARKWCWKHKERGREAVISAYSLDENALGRYKVLRFDSFSAKWLDFIVNCRNGNDTGDYEIVIGGAVDDTVFNTLELYQRGLIDQVKAVDRLKDQKPNDQVVIRFQKVMDEVLRFQWSERI